MSSEDPLSSLPTELCLSIIENLSPKGLFALSQVSCQWRNLCDGVVLLQVKLGLPRLLSNTTQSISHISDWSSQDVDILLRELPRISATDYFSNTPTFRTLGLALRLLGEAWDGGRPSKVEILNSRRHQRRQHNAYHNRAITSVVIDPENHSIITGDIEGLVICWDIKTGQNVEHHVIYEDPSNPFQRAIIGAMALKDDLLAIGCWMNLNVEYPTFPRVQLYHRSPLSTWPTGSGYAGHFTVPSSVMSIKIEGTVCIVACTSGQIEFWRLRDGNIGNRQSQSRVHAARALAINPVHSTALDVLPGQQVTLLYYRPYLGVLDSSTSVWHPKVPAGEQDLWDYPSSEIVRTPAARITGTRSIEPPGDCTCSFFSSILSGYLAALNLPKSESISVLGAYSQEQPADWSNNTISTISDKTIRSLALMPGYFAIGTQAVTRPLHQLPSSEADVHLFHENGDEIAVYQDHHGDVNAIALDPCFLVSVSDDLTIKVRDFTPQLSGHD